MRYTVKQVAEMSGVSVRTLHFYDETGLLTAARHAENGYRVYGEAELLKLQQILFYRELGMELKEIQRVLGQADFEKTAALRLHRKALEERLARTQELVRTIDRTVRHLEGGEEMEGKEMFAGFRVDAGKGRFGEQVKLGGQPHDCKVSGRDTGGAMAVFEFWGSSSGPRCKHLEEDEWIYVIEGECEFEVGEERFRVGAGESVFVPKAVAHAWVATGGAPAKVIDVFQPAGKMEEFFRELGKYSDPPVHEAVGIDGLRQLFAEHGMKMTGPPMPGEWAVERGRIVRKA
jgi:DNA-binding transcriptional MerR regulator/quercetin dioxygenase-like cupin family protein